MRLLIFLEDWHSWNGNELNSLKWRLWLLTLLLHKRVGTSTVILASRRISFRSGMVRWRISLRCIGTSIMRTGRNKCLICLQPPVDPLRTGIRSWSQPLLRTARTMVLFAIFAGKIVLLFIRKKDKRPYGTFYKGRHKKVFFYNRSACNNSQWNMNTLKMLQIDFIIYYNIVFFIRKTAPKHLARS